MVRRSPQRVREQSARADVILWCDERGEFGEADAERLAATGADVIRVRTKCDLRLQETGDRRQETEDRREGTQPVSREPQASA